MWIEKRVKVLKLSNVALSTKPLHTRLYTANHCSTLWKLGFGLVSKKNWQKQCYIQLCSKGVMIKTFRIQFNAQFTFIWCDCFFFKKIIEFLQQTLIFHTYIFATKCRRPKIFQTMNSVRLNNLSFKCQWFTPLDCKDKGIRNIEFVAETQFLYRTLLVWFPDLPGSCVLLACIGWLCIWIPIGSVTIYTACSHIYI